MNSPGFQDERNILNWNPDDLEKENNSTLEKIIWGRIRYLLIIVQLHDRLLTVIMIYLRVWLSVRLNRHHYRLNLTFRLSVEVSIIIQNLYPKRMHINASFWENYLFCHMICRFLGLLSKIEKVTRGFQGEKSGKDTGNSSGNVVWTIGAWASPKRGGTRYPEG